MQWNYWTLEKPKFSDFRKVHRIREKNWKIIFFQRTSLFNFYNHVWLFKKPKSQWPVRKYLNCFKKCDKFLFLLMSIFKTLKTFQNIIILWSFHVQFKNVSDLSKKPETSLKISSSILPCIKRRQSKQIFTFVSFITFFSGLPQSSKSFPFQPFADASENHKVRDENVSHGKSDRGLREKNWKWWHSRVLTSLRRWKIF